MSNPSSTGIDWNAVIEQGLQVVGQAVNGQPVPTYYPTFTPTTSAFSSTGSILPLLLVAGAAILVLRGPRR